MKKILVTQLRRLGDIILTTPVIDVLHKKFTDEGEDVEIDCLVEKQFSDVLVGNPYIRKIYSLDKNNKGDEDTLHTILNIRKEKYDYLFDFFGNPRSAWISFFSGAKETYSFDFRIRKHLYKHIVKRRSGLKYAVDFKMDLLKDFGIKRGYTKTSFYIEDALVYDKKIDIKTNGWNGKDKIVGIVAPNVRDRAMIKNWIFERYIQIIDKLVDELGVFVILLWGPGEMENAINIKNNVKMPYKCMMIKEGNIRDLAAIIKNCDALLSTCSGPKHIAVALDIPTVTIFGPTNSVSCTPPNSEKHLPLFAENLDCISCERHECIKKTKECMELITVDIVFEKLKQLLDK
jgi:ADP-heptose:LPS heptosyltransferase